MDQEPSEIVVPAFADAKQLGLSAGGTLFRNKAEPGSELSSLGERCSRSDGSHNGSCCQRADAGNGKEAPASGIGFCNLLDLKVQPVELGLDEAPLFHQLLDHSRH